MTHIAHLPRTERPYMVGGSRHQDEATEERQQWLARMTGFLFVVTFATSIPAYFVSSLPRTCVSFRKNVIPSSGRKTKLGRPLFLAPT